MHVFKRETSVLAIDEVFFVKRAKCFKFETNFSTILFFYKESQSIGSTSVKVEGS